jgi:hypothetical protein
MICFVEGRNRLDPVHRGERAQIALLVMRSIRTEDRGMATTDSFRFPFSPPDLQEAQALARAATYLLRAANEVESSRLRTIGFFAASCPLDDLPAALSAAGHLCDALIDFAPSPNSS